MFQAIVATAARVASESARTAVYDGIRMSLSRVIRLREAADALALVSAQHKARAGAMKDVEEEIRELLKSVGGL